MRPSFYPRTINGPFDDPGVFIPFLFEKRAFIFDIGDMPSLSSGDILKITHAFVSHTHMDHFAGFDSLLRLFLGREKDFYIYGPEGFLKNIEGKLAGYCWNLVQHYSNRFILYATEICQEYMLTNQYPCQTGFRAIRDPVKQPFNGVLLAEPSLSVSSVILDHSIPCLGFSIKEQFHINIIKEKVEELGLEIGPWLKEFKDAVFYQHDMNSVFDVKFGKGGVKQKQFVLGDLAEQIALITPGQKITYITDVGYLSNADKIIEFAKDSDYFFIEAGFLEKDKDIAEQKYHLTAWQAGTIAGKARVKQFTIFHFSPRYTDMEHLLQQEARDAYEAALSL